MSHDLHIKKKFIMIWEELRFREEKCSDTREAPTFIAAGKQIQPLLFPLENPTATHTPEPLL
jgi:hypothetical protein